MAQLQEAQFACFEDDDVDVSSGAFLSSSSSNGGSSSDHAASLAPHHVSATGLKTFTIAEPHGATRSLPQKSFAKVRSLECSGSGSFYFQNEALKDRFICWRVIKNIVVLREWSLHETLASNGVRLQFAAPVVSTGVHAVESWEGNTVTICVVTHAGAIHRFTYAIPATATHSIFSTADTSFPPKPATSVKSDTLQALTLDEVISVALWVNEYNLVLGADSGRVLGVNFGLPTTPTGDVEMQAFAFSDASVVARLWHGLVQSSAAKWHGSGAGASRDAQANAIVALTCFPISSQSGDGEDDAMADGHGADDDDDVCIVTVSADLTLRVWSYASQSCLGKQQIRSLVTADDEDEAIDTLAVSAKIVALPATSSANCRLLVHVDTTASFSQAIYLLKGDVTPLPSGGRRELALTAARVFTVTPATAATPLALAAPARLKIVDFAVDKNYLYSSWRSATGDAVYCHANPMALTGPRIIRGDVVSSVNAQMHTWDVEDDAWASFDLSDDRAVALVDAHFAERVLLPGRFSRQNLYNAVREYHGDVDVPLRALFASSSAVASGSHYESKYTDLLVQIVSDKWLQTMRTSGGSSSARDPTRVRIGIWKSILELCNKHWRVENVPIGFVATTNALLPGSPVLLRRNRVSLLFPSPAAITAPFTATLDASRAECVRELVTDILPVFDAFPSASFAAAVARDVTDAAVDAQAVESLVALARHCVRRSTRAPRTAVGGSASEPPDLALTRALLRLSKVLGSETEFHDHVLRDLVEHLFPFDAAAQSSSSSGPAAPSPSKRRPSYEASDVSDDDASMDGSSDASSSADRVASAALSSSRHLFGGSAMASACAHVASRTIDAMCTQTLRVVLFLSYLADAQPAFLSAAIVRAITRSYLPRAIAIYQRWHLSKWLASQNLVHVAESDASTSRATLLPSLLQLFVVDANAKLNATSALKRARSVLDLARVTPAVQSEEAQRVLASFAREVVRLVATPSEPLVRFLQHRKQFALVRALVSCSLRDATLAHSSSSGGAAAGGGKSERAEAQSAALQRAVQAIGECLAREGHAAAALSGASARDAHARWCFEQAIRCFRIGLSAYLSDHDEPPRFDRAAERFVYDTISLLKETAPRAHADLVLDYLWTVVTQALTRSGESDGALQTFVWVNVFKCSVERQRFRDAHVALMHTLDASSGLDVAARARDSAPLATATECVTYFVNELCRSGQLDLVCDLEWGALAADVETHLQWQAANANVVSSTDGSSVDAAVLTYHDVLYAYYMRRHEPANAAAAMHALYLRLRLAPLKARSALEAQRNALNTAQTALLALPAANRWIVRKYHGEELLVSACAGRRLAVDAATPTTAADRLPLDIVTLADMTRDLAVLDGKLQLLHLGRCDESVLLSTMDGDDVVALLVDAAIAVCEHATRTTLAKERESRLALELALAIATKSSERYSPITKSLARYCVSVAHRVGIESLCWRLLEDVLAALDRDCERSSLAQYEVAAATILDWHVKIVLPPWLVARLGDRKRGNPAKLLQLYLAHGLLRDALQLADAMVPDELLSESEARFQQRVTTRTEALPWLPYALFDALLDAVDAAVRSSSTSSVRALQDAAQQFRAKLTSYFKYIALLEDARAAASVAQSASATSSGGFGFGFGASVRAPGAL